MWGTTLEFLKRMTDKRRRSKVRKRNLVAKQMLESRALRERTEQDRRQKLLEKALRALDDDYDRY